VLSELVSHKNIGVAVEAFNRMKLPLVVVGDGPERRHLRSIAGSTVSFTGRVSDERVSELLSASRGLVVTSVEEFGIAAVEAQAAGRPVIAVGSGGAIETVEDGVTGRLWVGGADELVDAVQGFDTMAVDPEACVQNARRFDVEVFRRALPREIDAAFAARAEQSPGAHPGEDLARRPRRRRGGLARSPR